MYIKIRGEACEEGCKIKYKRKPETLTIKHHLDVPLCVDTGEEGKFTEKTVDVFDAGRYGNVMD